MKARLNHLTQMFEWSDGTIVAREIVDGVSCLADFLVIANIRERQRDATDPAPSATPAPPPPPESAH